MIPPSVTQILSPYSDFSRIPRAVLDAAAARGTAVHDVCATIARGLPIIGQIDPEIIGYVNSFQRWFDLIVDEVLLVEDRLIDNEFGYHGEPDLIIKAKHGEVILVDNKTPVQLLKTWRLQCSGYYNLAAKNIIKPDRTGSLRLSKDGKAAKMEYYDNSAADFVLFLQALNLYRFFNNK